jgi:hypothetical protein
MSWKALDWATDINVGSPTMRLILILLANKADEQFLATRQSERSWQSPAPREAQSSKP